MVFVVSCSPRSAARHNGIEDKQHLNDEEPPIPSATKTKGTKPKDVERRSSVTNSGSFLGFERRPQDSTLSLALSEKGAGRRRCTHEHSHQSGRQPTEHFQSPTTQPARFFLMQHFRCQCTFPMRQRKEHTARFLGRQTLRGGLRFCSGGECESPLRNGVSWVT